MKPTERVRAQRLRGVLRSYEARKRVLLGIHDAARRAALLEQIIESIRRIEYVSAIHKRKLSPLRADPSSDHFDPLKAAVLCAQRGDTDEAFWLVFLSVHFGRHGRDGWRLCRDVYAGTTPSALWTWAHVTSNVSAFRNWLAAQAAIWKNDGASRHFGNHHKYQSIDAWKKNGTGAAVQSYVEWVLLHKSHGGLVQDALNNAGVGPGKVFDYLYRSMEAVVSFGRMARFDYLTMVGKLGLAAIEPSSPYLGGATGPRKGALLLFANDIKASIRTPTMEGWLVELGADLGVGMQVLEDALCNWQKSPDRFTPFRG